MTTAVLRRVLVTGATGFIGRRLHRLLLDHGVAVRALLRPGSSGATHLDPRCDVVAAALDDDQALADAAMGVDAVVYVAGAVRGRLPADFHAANVAGVAAVAAAVQRSSPAALLLLLSSLAASRPELSAYAASKRQGERALAASGLEAWSVLRPPAVYGPGDAELRGLFDLARRGLALRPGPRGQRLALLHVDDVCRAVLAALTHADACRGRTFEIDDGRPGGYDWDAIGQAVAGRRVRQVGVPAWLLGALARANLAVSAVTGRAPMLTPGKVRELRQSRWLCDNRAFTLATGWAPQIDLASGAARLFQPPTENDTT
ncbi:MAG: NAD-dependent epimerase/dehydratase family protein [Pseudomonadales bacterium]